uniref:Exostosin GT47 domain-containing protein n=1 Tax=Populus trichocarpa TaxID=3694 RepID=A0A2K1XL90_POPTR
MDDQAFGFISSNWPYWNRTEGADHFFVVPHDFGACFHYQEEKAIKRGILPLLQRATLVQTFGQRNHVCLRDGFITVPPYAPPQKMQTHLIPEKTPEVNFSVWENFMDNPLFDISTEHLTIPRLVKVVIFGYIAIIIADDIVLPFADAIPWEEIEVFVDEKDVPNLDTILTSIPPEVILRKQRLIANPSMKQAMLFP